MAGKNLQHKYQNNEVVTAGYIRAELKQEDGLLAGKQFYVAVVPAGVLIKGMIGILDSELPSYTADITVDVGMNDCLLCSATATITGDAPVCDFSYSSNLDCSCKLTDKDYLVRVTIDNNDVIDGDIMLLIEVVNPNHVICSVEPMDFCTETVIIDPCTPEADCGCGDQGNPIPPVINLTTTVTTGA